MVSLLLAEIVSRYFLPIPEERLLPFHYNAGRVRQIVQGDVFLGFDADLGWTPTPNRVRRADGAVYRISRQGLRSDREYDQQPAPGVQRLAAFGDSFTHCSEVTQDECWAARLEAAWPKTEVLNFGVPGYGPDQAWLRYGRDGRQYQACGVLIGFFIGDIERVVNRFRPFIHPDDSVVLSKPRFLLDGDGLKLLPNPVTDPRLLGDPAWVEQTLGHHDAWYFPGTFVPGALDASALVRVARTAAYQQARADLHRTGHKHPLYRADQEAFEITGRILVQFTQQVRDDGASPVVVVFPGRADLLADRAGIQSHAPLIAWMERAGVPIVDLTPRLAWEAIGLGIDALFEDTHYSTLGNAIVSDELKARLPEILAQTCALGG